MAGVIAAVQMQRAESGGSSNTDGNHQRQVVSEKSSNDAMQRILSTRKPNSEANNLKLPGMDQVAQEHAAAIRLQAIFRSKVLYKHRLHRDNLSQRLLFEWSLFYGAFRLLNQVMVFALLLIAVQLSGNPSTKRGIYGNLAEHFDFETLTETSQRSQIQEILNEISTRSKDFFLLSSKYFEPEATGGTVELIGPMETFSQAKVIGGVQLSIHIPDFSFTCWVRTVRQFKRGYLIRKRIIPAGTGSELACWGWHLTDSHGPALHYGGSVVCVADVLVVAAHDFFSTSEVVGGTAEQEDVALEEGRAFPPETFVLMTLVVSQSKAGVHTVTFYRNLEEVGSRVLKRPITDCFNNLEGVLVGDQGLTLGQLRFYPRAMTLSSIQEIYEGGSFLSDISTGSVPTRPAESELAVMSRGLRTAFVNVEQSVADQQPRAEIDLVLQSVEAALANTSPAPRAPAAPPGMTPIDPTLRRDEVTGRAFTQLLDGPVRLDQPALGEERYFDPASFPDWSGAGVSFTMWYRHPPCNIVSCGTYLISAHHEGAQSSARCWSLWIEDIAVYFDAKDSVPSSVYQVGVMEEKFHVSNLHWRHLAFVFDEERDYFLFYQDGDLVFSTSFGGSVKDAHCSLADFPNMRITYGARFPTWSWGLEIEMYDMRAYVGKPLSAADIHALAFARADPLGMLAYPQQAGESVGEWGARTDKLRHTFRCSPLDSPIMMDKPWQDLYGHTCQWFHDNKENFPGVCELPEARVECPIACNSLQECFSNFEVPEAYFVWKSIRRVEKRGPRGTICLGDQQQADEIVARCREWSARPEAYAEAAPWRREEEQSRAARVNLTDCAELAASIDTSCAFNQSEVRRFTQAILRNGGDYTLGFWMKPISEESLFPDGRFFPHLQLISSFSPPRHNLGWGYYVESGAVGAARLTTACPKDGVAKENVETTTAAPSGWSFLALARINSTFNTTTGSQGQTATNLELVYESAGSFTQCLFDESSLFKAMEFNFPALVSPLVLVPAALPFAKVQEIFYTKRERMRIRDGPLVTNAEREVASILVEKKDYGLRSVLMAAPIIFTTRTQPNSTCPFEYATQWLREQHKAVVDSQCAEPFECDEAVLRTPSATMACSGGPQDSQPFFGLEPANFRGMRGFSDLLFSITDSPFVFRGGELRSTSDFVDSQTHQVHLILVFFTPEYGITTVQEVTMDLSGPKDIEVGVAVRHYSILEGSPLRSYVVVQCLVLVSIAGMLLDVLYGVRKACSHREDGEANLRVELLKHATDAMTVIAVTAFVILRLPVIINTASETERILGELTGIPWGSPTMPMPEKKEIFFRAIEDLLSQIENTESLDSFLNVILIISLIRVIQCTSLHPRLALLTGTVAKALDDFWHSVLLIVLMMSSFAFIGTWRFGDELEEFGSFERSMQTEVELMFGEFIEGWHENRDLQAFVMLYYIVMFMLVLNFLLAIIVEAYMGVRQEVETLEIEQEFLTDLYTMAWALVAGRWYGWPSTSDLGKILHRMDAKLSVGFMDLHNLPGRGGFQTQAQIGSFLRFYSRFDFLQPPEIGSHGVRRSKTEDMEDRIVKRVCDALNVREKRLKDIAAPRPLPPKPLPPASPPASPLGSKRRGSFLTAFRAPNARRSSQGSPSPSPRRGSMVNAREEAKKELHHLQAPAAASASPPPETPMVASERPPTATLRRGVGRLYPVASAEPGADTSREPEQMDWETESAENADALQAGGAAADAAAVSAGPDPSTNLNGRTYEV